MIIRIQDRNVSTENILDIGEVTSKVNFTHLWLSFTVNLINGKSFEVEKVMEFKEAGIDRDSRKFIEYLAYHNFLYYSTTSKFDNFWEFKKAVINPNTWGNQSQNLTRFYEFIEEFFKEEITVEVEKVKKVHQELLTLWNDNKSEIPTFKI